MAERFLKLIYFAALIYIVGAALVGLYSAVEWDRVTITTYQAKCNANGQYVVLQGSKIGEPYEFNEVTYEDTIYSDTKETLNFYCKYYDDIQQHIVSYAYSNDLNEQRFANAKFWEFRESAPYVSSYPALYTLEAVNEHTNYDYVIYGLLSPIIMGFISFLFLQLVRMSVIYVVFGAMVWHPFKLRK